MKAIDEAAINRSYRFDIGKRRPDGKHNVWEKRFVRSPYEADWVIVHVGDDWHAAKHWIDANGRRAA